jgi:hypothetical protein
LTTEIEVKESIEDKKTWLSVKRFQFRGLKVEGPIKTVDLGKTSLQHLPELGEGKYIYERARRIDDAAIVKKIIDETSESKVRASFGMPAWASNELTTQPITLGFNPLREEGGFASFAPLLDYHYQFSKGFILVPNPSQVGGWGNQEIIEFVELAYNYYNTKNNKPIFVPISMDWSLATINAVTRYYVSKERVQLWVDFCGKPVNDHASAKMTAVNRILEEKKLHTRAVIYATNIKREIISHHKSEFSDASDALVPLLGVTIVGVNREPSRPIGKKITEEIRQHKSRRFIPETYYYQKFNALKKDEGTNVTMNTALLQNEFKTQSIEFLKEFNVTPYLQSKKMITENEGILRLLSKEQRQLSNWW